METEDSDPKVSNIEGAGEEEKTWTADPAATGAAATESADDPEHAAAATHLGPAHVMEVIIIDV